VRPYRGSADSTRSAFAPTRSRSVRAAVSGCPRRPRC